MTHGRLACPGFDPGDTLTEQGSLFCKRRIAGEACGWHRDWHGEVLDSEDDAD